MLGNTSPILHVYSRFQYFSYLYKIDFFEFCASNPCRRSRAENPALKLTEAQPCSRLVSKRAVLNLIGYGTRYKITSIGLTLLIFTFFPLNISVVEKEELVAKRRYCRQPIHSILATEKSLPKMAPFWPKMKKY